MYILEHFLQIHKNSAYSIAIANVQLLHAHMKDEMMFLEKKIFLMPAISITMNLGILFSYQRFYHFSDP